MTIIADKKRIDGNFIVIEGIDSSGKETQAKRLIKKFKEEGKDVKYVDFPSYNETEFGRLVAKFLRGEYGKRKDLNQESICLLYALDRYQFKEEYKNFLKKGGTIIANRYTQSNLGFQTADLKGKAWDNLVDWILDLEKRMPQPDLVFLLDIDPEKAQKLMDQKSLRDYLNSEKKDINEEKIELQKKVRENYIKLAGELDWEVVNCIKNGELRSIEAINQELWKKSEKKLDI